MNPTDTKKITLASPRAVRAHRQPSREDMERLAILGEANWGSYLSNGLHGAASGAAGGAAAGGVAGAIGGAGVGAAPGAAAGAVLGGAGGFLSGFLGNAATDLAYNFKSPQDKASHMAGAVQEKLAVVASFLEKTDPQRAQALQRLGQQFKDYIDATVQGKQGVNLSGNVFAQYLQQPQVATAAVRGTRFRAANSNSFTSSLGEGALGVGMNYLGTRDPRQALQQGAQDFAIDRVEDAATGALRNQISKGTGSAAQYLSRGFNPAAAAGGAEGAAAAGGAAALGGFGAVALPAAAGMAAGMAGGAAADYVGDAAQNVYYGGDAGRVKAEMQDVDKMVQAMGSLTISSPEGTRAVQLLSQILTNLMPPAAVAPATASAPSVQANANAQPRRFARRASSSTLRTA